MYLTAYFLQHIIFFHSFRKPAKHHTTTTLSLSHFISPPSSALRSPLPSPLITQSKNQNPPPTSHHFAPSPLPTSSLLNPHYNLQLPPPPNRYSPLQTSLFLLQTIILIPKTIEYAQVVKMLGNGRIEAMCFDGEKRLGHIRGKMRKKVCFVFPFFLSFLLSFFFSLVLGFCSFGFWFCFLGGLLAFSWEAFVIVCGLRCVRWEDS